MKTPSNMNFNLQAYIDIRVIAGLLRFYQRQGLLPKDKRIRMSDVARQSLELLHDGLAKQGLTPVESTEEAVFILRECGLATDQIKTSNKPLIRSLQFEALQEDNKMIENILDSLTPEQQAAALKVEREILAKMGRE